MAIEEIRLVDLMEVISRKKWRILIPTLVLVVFVLIVSFFLPKKWEIDMIVLPGKFLIQTEQRGVEEFVVVDPRQLAGQINQKSYDESISQLLNIDVRKLPKFKAENLRNTKLVRVAIRSGDINKGKAIMSTLFDLLRQEADKKIDVEIKTIESSVITLEQAIKKKELDIQSMEIEKTKLKMNMVTAENKLKISEARFLNITEEMKSVRQRIEQIEEQQKKTLGDVNQKADALGLLLYSNEIQQSLRYYDNLDEKLSVEKITQENLRLQIKQNQEEIKKLDTEIEKLKREIDDMKNQISLLKEKKARIDYTELVKSPTVSVKPVFPNKKLNGAIALILGLTVFTFVAFAAEYWQQQKNNRIK